MAPFYVLRKHMAFISYSGRGGCGDYYDRMASKCLQILQVILTEHMEFQIFLKLIYGIFNSSMV